MGRALYHATIISEVVKLISEKFKLDEAAAMDAFDYTTKAANGLSFLDNPVMFFLLGGSATGPFCVFYGIFAMCKKYDFV